MKHIFYCLTGQWSVLMFSKALCSWCESVVSMFSLPSVRISAHFEQNRTEQMLLSSLLPLHSPPSPCGYCIWFLLYQLLTQKENTCPEQSFETSFRTHSSNWSFVESTVMYCSIYSILFFYTNTCTVLHWTQIGALLHHPSDSDLFEFSSPQLIETLYSRDKDTD